MCVSVSSTQCRTRGGAIVGNNVGIVNPTIGGSYSTWGDLADANIARINKAFGDTLTLSDTSGTVVLTQDQSNNAAFVFDGSGAGTVTVHVLDNIGRIWFVDNQRVSGSVAFRCAAGGDTVTLAAGQRRLVRSDGTDCLDVTLLTLAISDITGLQAALDLKALIASPSLTTTITLTLTDAGAAAGPLVTLLRDSATPAASDLLSEIIFAGKDSGAATQTYGVVGASILDPTAASEDGSLYLRTVVAGTLTTQIVIASTGVTFVPPVVPATNDGAALGSTSLMWSDLFLASGGVINWNNGAMTLEGIATQAQQETATAINVAVSPGRQHAHPGHPKAWGLSDPTLSALTVGYNITSVTDGGTGVISFNLTVAFSSNNYAVVPGIGFNTTTGYSIQVQLSTASQVTLYCVTSAASTLTDPSIGIMFSAFGDQ